VAGGFAIYEGVHFLHLKSETDDFRNAHATAGGVPSKEAICQAAQGPVAWNPSGPGAAKTICDDYDSARTASLLGIVSGSVAVASLGVGTYLLLTDTSSKKEASSTLALRRRGRGASAPRMHFLPYVGPRGSGLDVRVVF